jgi:hypothetical protein
MGKDQQWWLEYAGQNGKDQRPSDDDYSKWSLRLRANSMRQGGG